MSLAAIVSRHLDSIHGRAGETAVVTLEWVSKLSGLVPVTTYMQGARLEASGTPRSCLIHRVGQRSPAAFYTLKHHDG
ncbi:hypothetical protein BM221_004041 [Beauveria bassiana]|uniref:Uncharacterized protein n=1 Tax=Beauveria bassiana TaxID=176275 RepID=A0A2N6NQ45_BEABA|nr:hypothetical protein BM221_004041 [Beauveria bassiana]